MTRRKCFSFVFLFLPLLPLLLFLSLLSLLSLLLLQIPSLVWKHTTHSAALKTWTNVVGKLCPAARTTVGTTVGTTTTVGKFMRTTPVPNVDPTVKTLAALLVPLLAPRHVPPTRLHGACIWPNTTRWYPCPRARIGPPAAEQVTLGRPAFDRGYGCRRKRPKRKVC